MSDQELKEGLSELLPEKIYVEESNPLPDTLEEALSNPSFKIFLWKGKVYKEWKEILDTEWLYVCWLICQEMNSDQLNELCHKTKGYLNYSWQQRAEAIIKTLTPCTT